MATSLRMAEGIGSGDGDLSIVARPAALAKSRNLQVCPVRWGWHAFAAVDVPAATSGCGWPRKHGTCQTGLSVSTSQVCPAPPGEAGLPGPAASAKVTRRPPRGSCARFAGRAGGADDDQAADCPWLL